MRDAQLSERIIGAAMEVHTHLGPGLLESAYRRCLVHELRLRGIQVSTEVPIDLDYKGLDIREGYRIDLVVADTVIVEIKVAEKFHPLHEAQLLTYMRLSNKHVGLLLNFHVKLLRDGIKRLVL